MKRQENDPLGWNHMAQVTTNNTHQKIVKETKNPSHDNKTFRSYETDRNFIKSPNQLIIIIIIIIR